MTVQLSGVRWYQDDRGEDHYEKTREIILFPKIVEVKQGEERVVRVAYRGRPGIRQEKSYRLFAQELPKKSEASGALSFALRFSVPIFITAKNTRPLPKVEGGQVKQGSAVVTVANVGTRHLIVSQIDLSGYSTGEDRVFQKQIKGWYVLPQSRKMFAIALDEAVCRKTNWIEAKIKVGRKILNTRFDVKPSQCSKPVKK